MFPSPRRSSRAPGLFPPPLSLQAAPAEPGPAPDRFEAVPAGESVLLRVYANGPVDWADAVLILDGGRGFDVVKALPGSTRALGFVIPARALDDGSRFWLDAGGRIHRLGRPELLPG